MYSIVKKGKFLEGCILFLSFSFFNRNGDE